MRVAWVNIKTGLVENCSEMGVNLPPNCSQPTTPPDGFLWIESDEAGIGWSYAAGKLVAPPSPPATAPQPVDPVVTLSQLQAALSAAGLDTVQVGAATAAVQANAA